MAVQYKKNSRNHIISRQGSQSTRPLLSRDHRLLPPLPFLPQCMTASHSFHKTPFPNVLTLQNTPRISLAMIGCNSIHATLFPMRVRGGQSRKRRALNGRRKPAGWGVGDGIGGVSGGCCGECRLRHRLWLVLPLLATFRNSGERGGRTNSMEGNPHQLSSPLLLRPPSEPLGNNPYGDASFIVSPAHDLSRGIPLLLFRWRWGRDW